MAIVKVTREMAEAARREIDWAGFDAITDEEIARQIAENPDAAPDLTLAQAKLLFRLGAPRMRIGAKIRLVRRALGKSQAQFARDYRLPLRSLQNWEQGTREPDEAVESLLRLIVHAPDEARRVLSEG
jgi:putative transcriptional regulator